MWIESNYLKRQLETMRFYVGEQAEKSNDLALPAWNMCMNTIECIEKTIYILETNPLGHFETYRNKEQSE